MSNAIALAQLLEELPDTALARALAHTKGTLHHVHDVFDAVDLLDADDTVDARMTWLTRGQVERLRELSDRNTFNTEDPVDRSLAEAVLVDAHGTPLDRVAQRVHALSAAHTPTAEQTPQTTPRSDDGDLRTALAEGYTTVRLIYGLLVGVGNRPPQVLAKGGIGRSHRATLAGFLSVDSDQLPLLLTLAESARLLAKTSQQIALPTPEAHAWMLASDAQRLTDLTAGFLARLPRALSQAVRDALLTGASPWWQQVEDALPFATAVLAEYRAPVAECARALGLTTDTATTPAAALLLAPGGQAQEDLETFAPGTVDYFYPQADASVIAPGRLRADIDQRLLQFSRCVRFGDASTYVLTAETVIHGLNDGMTAQEMLTFLDAHARGGTPQPLRYLITDSAEHFGQVRIRAEGRGTRISASSAAIATTLLHDRELTALGLIPVSEAPTDLLSPFPPETTFNALSEAHYPVASGGRPSGSVTFLPSGRPVGTLLPWPGTGDPSTEALAVAQSLHRSVEGGDADLRAGQIAHILEFAVKRRVPVRIRVARPGAAEGSFNVEPTGIGGGRLRGRDPQAQTERTFPLSSILAVDVIDQH